MPPKTLSVIALSVAVVAASISAAIVTSKRASRAAAASAAASALAEAEQAKAKAKARDAEIAASQERAAKAKEKAAAEERAKSESDVEAARIEEAAAKESRKKAEAMRQTAEAEAKTAKENRLAAKLKAQTAADEKAKAEAVLKTEMAKASAEADRLAGEKLKADKVIAEAKLSELRKIDFETAERDLREWQHDLEERERALQPEKTIADLSWAGGTEDTVIDAEGNLIKQKKVPYLAENDRDLPIATRRLARVRRKESERFAAGSANVRNAVVSSLEKLYVESIRDHRVVDAEYYGNVLRSFYPDWKFSADNSSVTNGAAALDGKSIK